jgi:hypothetical protein
LQSLGSDCVHVAAASPLSSSTSTQVSSRSCFSPPRSCLQSVILAAWRPLEPDNTLPLHAWLVAHLGLGPLALLPYAGLDLVHFSDVTLTLNVGHISVLQPSTSPSITLRFDLVQLYHPRPRSRLGHAILDLDLVVITLAPISITSRSSRRPRLRSSRPTSALAPLTSWPPDRPRPRSHPGYASQHLYPASVTPTSTATTSRAPNWLRSLPRLDHAGIDPVRDCTSNHHANPDLDLVLGTALLTPTSSGSLTSLRALDLDHISDIVLTSTYTSPWLSLTRLQSCLDRPTLDLDLDHASIISQLSISISLLSHRAPRRPRSRICHADPGPGVWPRPRLGSHADPTSIASRPRCSTLTSIMTGPSRQSSPRPRLCRAAHETDLLLATGLVSVATLLRILTSTRSLLYSQPRPQPRLSPHAALGPDLFPG